MTPKSFRNFLLFTLIFSVTLGVLFSDNVSAEKIKKCQEDLRYSRPTTVNAVFF